MRRWLVQDPKNEPYMGFCTGFFNKNHDLVGFGACLEHEKASKIWKGMSVTCTLLLRTDNISQARSGLQRCP
jgi:hypothetical protein